MRIFLQLIHSCTIGRSMCGGCEWMHYVCDSCFSAPGPASVAQVRERERGDPPSLFTTEPHCTPPGKGLDDLSFFLQWTVWYYSYVLLDRAVRLFYGYILQDPDAGVSYAQSVSESGSRSRCLCSSLFTDTSLLPFLWDRLPLSRV